MITYQSAGSFKKSRITTTDFINRANAIHNCRYSYDRCIYEGTLCKVEIFCPAHDLYFFQRPSAHLQGQGCPKCAKEKTAMHTVTTMTSADFLEKAKKLFNELYTYALDDNDIIKLRKDKIEITCTMHKCKFLCSPFLHLAGKKCPECVSDDVRAKLTKTVNKDEFVDRASALYPHCEYDLLPNADLLPVNKKIAIHCRTHETVFLQTPNSHLKSVKCPQCVTKTRSDSLIKRMETSDFIAAASKTFRNRYDYSLVQDSNVSMRSKVQVKCRKHGIFLVTPHAHLTKMTGCPSCSHNVSNLETLWLDSLGIPHENRNVKIDLISRACNVDGYDPSTNTVYQFHGDFWHGHPTLYDSQSIHPKCKVSYGELYNKTCQTDQQIIEAGFTLVVMWEHEFNIKRKSLPLPKTLKT